MKISLNKANKEQKELDDAFSTMIKARDNWMCSICGTDYRPCCHHIIDRSHKEFRYDPSNAITLCNNHHKFSRVISAHNNPFAFFLWLQRFRSDLSSVAIERTKKILENDGIKI